MESVQFILYNGLFLNSSKTIVQLALGSNICYCA